jgi:hypothetical protein
MTYSSLGLSFRNIATIAVAAAAMAAGACSTNMGSSTSSLANGAANGAANDAQRVASAYSWSSWVSVAPSPGIPTEVTGINNLSTPEIVGFYTITTSGNPESFSFTSEGLTYSSNTTYASYPRVHGGGKQTYPPMGTQMYGIATQAKASELPVLAGWVNQPGDQGGTWPVVDNQGLWSLEHNGTGAGTGKNGATAELFGINDSNIAVGCVTSSPVTSAMTGCSASDATASYFTVDGTPETIPLNLATGSASSSTAYGIDDGGDMVGVATVKSANVSWYALCIKNCATSGYTGTGKSSYCYAALTNGSYTSTTTAYGITASRLSGGTLIRLVVGSYSEGSGTSKVTHGFLAQVELNTANNMCEQIGTPQKIDEPNANTLTVVRGVNDEVYIVGYYINKNGKQLGFVGIPSDSARLRRVGRPISNAKS